MKLEVATLVLGSETPTGDGITGALRCVLILPDGRRRAAVLKRGSVGQIAAEAFSALLLRRWGLPVPEPFLINEASGIAFASADTAYPNLKQHLGLDALPAGAARNAAMLIACDLACKLPSTPLAAACDEAIDNRDRNLGNILWDGQAEAWIDHAFALGEGVHLPDDNKLCIMASSLANYDNIVRSSVAQALVLDRTSPSEVDDVLADSPIGRQDLAVFIATRISSLGNRMLARFPSSADLLSGA